MIFSDALMERLKKAYSVGALTGAGVSAASGVPTFRGKNGLWKKFRPEQLANFQAFSKNPGLVWEWYNWRKKLIGEVQPNFAHYSLVDMEHIFPDFGIITQNVDNLHETAGSRTVYELHGNIMRSKCAKCGRPFEGEFEEDHEIPRCETCGGLIRPDVVWFGEILPAAAVEGAQDLASRSEVFFSIGTSGLVEPAASIPYIAKGNGAFLVEINTEPTPLSPHADEVLTGSVEKILPDLVIELQQIRR